MSKIIEIFGKDVGLDLSDVKNAIKSNILQENDEIELKDIDRATKDQRKRKIVTELISFLNSGRGIGLLILGLGQEDGEVIVKGVKSLKNSEQIRASIYEKIRSIPSNTRPFRLNIISIAINGNENIFLVEVQNNDLDCVYYSKIDNYVYIRRGDEAKSLDMVEFLDFLSKKNHARLFLKINEIEKIREDYSHSFSLRLINEGLEPGKFITTTINLIGIEESDYLFEGKSIKKQGNSIFEQTNGDKLSVPTFRVIAGYPPTSILIYPRLGVNIGTLSVKKDNFIISIIIFIYENKGFTQQIINIEAKNGDILINENTNEKFTFNKSYLQL